MRPRLDESNVRTCKVIRARAAAGLAVTRLNRSVCMASLSRLALLAAKKAEEQAALERVSKKLEQTKPLPEPPPQKRGRVSAPRLSVCQGKSCRKNDSHALLAALQQAAEGTGCDRGASALCTLPLHSVSALAVGVFARANMARDIAYDMLVSGARCERANAVTPARLDLWWRSPLAAARGL